MKRFLNLELKIDQRKLHSDQTGRFRGLVFNECHRRPGGNPQNAHRSGSRQQQYRCYTIEFNDILSLISLSLPYIFFA